MREARRSKAGKREPRTENRETGRKSTEEKQKRRTENQSEKREAMKKSKGGETNEEKQNEEKQMKRALLIYNPTAGRERAAKKAALAESILSGTGYSVDMYPTKEAGDATKAAAKAHRDYDTVIACGGDGTLSEVINGLGLAMSLGSGETKLGIIPAGTTNDFARALRIPMDVPHACRVITGGKVQKTDLGNLNGRLFINIAGGGNLTDIPYEVSSRQKTYLGQLAYYAKSIEKLPRLKPVNVRITTPGITLEEEIMLFLTANSSSVGGFRNLAPQASLTDGLLDLIVVKSVNLAEFLQLAARALSGDHIGHPRITYLQTASVEVTSTEPISLNTDGEYAGELPCSIKIHPHRIKIVVPA